MLNQNILLAAKDYIAQGTTLTPSLFLSGYPASYYKNARQWEFARFVGTSAAETYTVEDLGATRAIKLFAVLKHNMGNLGLWRVRAANSVAALTAAPVYDSGWMDAQPYDSSYGVDDWGTFDWGSETGFEFTEGINRNSYHPTPDVVNARYVRYDFNDEAEIYWRTDNYLQMARVWASDGYQPSLNMQYGAEIVLDDTTDEAESRNQVRHYSPLKVKARRLVAQFNDLPKDELLRNVFGPLYMQLGKAGELIAILSPLEPHNFVYEAIYGNLTQTDSGKYTFHDRMTSTLSVKESV